MASSESQGESIEITRMRKRLCMFFCGHCNKVVSKAMFYRHKTDVSGSGKVSLKTFQTMAFLLAFSHVQLPPWMALIVVMVCLKYFQLFYVFNVVVSGLLCM